MRAPVVVALAAAALPAAALADELAPGVTIGGEVYTSYQSSLRGGGRQSSVPLRAFDVDANDFHVDLVEVVIARELGTPAAWGDLGFHLDLAYGRLPALVNGHPDAGEDVLLHQAVVSYRAPTSWPIDLVAGKLPTPLGLEAMEPALNPNSSRSLLITFVTPITHVGAGVRLQPSPAIGYAQYVVNGVEVTSDNNDGKTLVGALTVTPELGDAKLTLLAAWAWGRERKEEPDQPDPQRILVEAAGSLQIGALTASLDGAAGHEGDASWQALSATVSVRLWSTVIVTPRYDWLRDRDGARTGVAQTVQSFTATLEKAFALGDRLSLGLRAELRVNGSDADVFPDGDQPAARRDQETVTFAAYARF